MRDVEDDVLDALALAGARGASAARVWAGDFDLEVVGARDGRAGDDARASARGDARSAETGAARIRAACACVARGDARFGAEDADADGGGGADAESILADVERNGALAKAVFVASASARARALGIGDEATWEHGLSDAARMTLEIVGQRRERGATGAELNAANGGKNADHLVKLLLAAGLVAVRKTKATTARGSVQNIVYLKRFEPSEKSHADERTAYFESFTRILGEAPHGTATTTYVRQSLHEEFANSSLFTDKTDKARFKVFAAAKAELCRMKCIEPVMSDQGDAMRLLRLYDAITIDDERDEDGEDGDDEYDDSGWTGRGVRGSIIVEQSLEAQVCERLREAASAVSQPHLFREFDVATRTIEKRILKMSDEDELFRRVQVQRGKYKTTCFVARDKTEEPHLSRQESGQRASKAPTEPKTDPMLVDDATRRRDILLAELRMKGFVYVNRLSRWLAVAEGGMYKLVDKSVVNALVGGLVKSGEAKVLDISWSVTDRQPDQILFHADFPFDPASPEDAVFIEALKEDIRATDIAERQPLSKKIAPNEIVRIEPMAISPTPPVALPSQAATAMDVQDDVQDLDVRAYRTVNDFHAIGLGYVKAAVVRLERLHMYLVENVFEAGIKDGTISDDVLNGNMPISTYIKLINSVESKTITAEDLDLIRVEALREKLMRDLPRDMHDKMQSTAYMSRLTRRLMGLALLHEVPTFDEKANQMNLTLTLRKHARFQIKAAPVEDESSWSKEFDVTTLAGAQEYWSELEKAFKGKPGMDRAQPASNITFPRLTAVRSWTRKWELGLENSIILTDRLRESWCALLKMLLARGSIPLDDSDLNVDEITGDRGLIAKAIDCLAEGGLPGEDALRVEQLAEDLGIPDGLALVKQLWRDYCYAKIASAVSEGIVSSSIGARALNMYARSSRFRVSKLIVNHAVVHGARGGGNPKRLAGLTATSPPKAITSSTNKVGSDAEKTQEDFDEEDSDGEFGFATTRKKFIFGEAEDEFLVFCMIRFIALSGSNALRAEKRDYRASIVFNDQMWRSRYPQVKRRALVKRWRQLTVTEVGGADDMNNVRHEAILRVGGEYYERGARARRDSALPHMPAPAPENEYEVERWDETWDGSGKWSEGIAKQVLQSTRSILREFPISYVVQRREPRSPHRRPKREEKVRRLRAGRDLTEADDDIILARLAPIAFLRRRAISFGDESDDSDEDDVSDYDDSDADEEVLLPFREAHEHEVPLPRLEALEYAQTLLQSNAPKVASCVAPNGPQVLALCQALVDKRISMSITTDAAASSLPPAFGDEGDSGCVFFNSPNAALRMLHSVKIEKLDVSNSGEAGGPNTIGLLQLRKNHVKELEPKCLRVIQARTEGGATLKDILDELRASKVSEAYGATGAYAVRAALDSLSSKGSIRIESAESELAYVCRKKSSSLGWACDDAVIHACARAVAGVALNHPGASETRMFNVLGHVYPLHVIAHALKHLLDQGILFERVVEKFTTPVPAALGGSTFGDDRNVIERFFFLVDETSTGTTNLLANHD